MEGGSVLGVLSEDGWTRAWVCWEAGVCATGHDHRASDCLCMNPSVSSFLAPCLSFPACGIKNWRRGLFSSF